VATPNAQRIELGILLRQFRDRMGLAQEAVEKDLGWHPGKCSRVELGSRTMVKTELDRLVELYELGPDEAELVRRLGADARKRDSISHVADWAQSYVSIERSATEIRYYDPELVPGFLQTEAYARAILATSGRTDVNALVADRLERQSLLTRADPIEVFIVLGEAALHRGVGTPAVAREQFEHLVAMNKRPNVHVRIMPFDAGAHAAMGTSFHLLSLGASQVKRVYLEGLSGGTYLHEGSDIGVYAEIFEQIWASVEDRKSATILRRRITELD